MFPTTRRRGRSDAAPRTVQDDFHRLFDRLLDHWWANGGPEASETAAYPVDIREDEKNIYVEAELPGFSKDEIDVNLEQGVLNISAEHREDKKEQEKQRSHLRERAYRRIERSFSLPTSVDESDVDAKLDDGVLRLTLKKTESESPRKIEIK